MKHWEGFLGVQCKTVQWRPRDMKAPPWSASSDEIERSTHDLLRPPLSFSYAALEHINESNLIGRQA